MRESLLEFLQCPDCSGAYSIARREHESEDEILTGALRCVKCGREVTVENGRLNMLRETPDILRENAGGLEHIERTRQRVKKYFLDVDKTAANDPWLKELPKYVENGEVCGHPLLASVEYAKHLTRDENVRTVLDLGAGDGWSTYHFARKFPVCIALDIATPPRIGLDTYQAFRQAGGEHYERICRSALDPLPFRDDALDMVTCSAGLHHFIPPDAVLREIFRVLKPGGVFLALREPFCAFYESNSRHHEEASRRIGSIEKASSYPAYRRAFQAAGFALKMKFHCNAFLAAQLEPTEIDRAHTRDWRRSYRGGGPLRRFFFACLKTPVLSGILCRIVFPALVYLRGNADHMQFISAYLFARKPAR